MTGHVEKKGTRWYVVIDHGDQPSRRCSGCKRTIWTDMPGLLSCERCGTELPAPVIRRRRQWHGSWRLKKGNENEQGAQDALIELLGQHQQGTYIAPKKQTLREFVENDWLPALQVRPSTAFSYGRNLRLHVLPAIGGVQLQSIDPAQLNQLYRSLLSDGNKGHKKGAGLSPRTVRYVHTILHRVLGDAVKWGRLARNMADAADPPRMRDALEAAPEMRTWTGPELAAFLRWSADDRYGPAFYFLATTGMRRGEALGLRWADVDLEAAKVSIRRARVMVAHKAVDGFTKTGAGRVIELDAGTVAVLRQQKSRQAQDRLLLGLGHQEERLVFCHFDARPFHPERFSREFDRKLERYNREHEAAPLPRIRLHDLRHTWATLALKSGEHPKVVAERLGHSNTNVTLNTYSHVVEGMQAKAAENVAALIFGS